MPMRFYTCAVSAQWSLLRRISRQKQSKRAKEYKIEHSQHLHSFDHMCFSLDDVGKSEGVAVLAFASANRINIFGLVCR